MSVLLGDASINFKPTSDCKESFYVSKMSAECSTQDCRSNDECHEMFNGVTEIQNSPDECNPLILAIKHA